jgi:hypothetical protein
MDPEYRPSDRKLNYVFNTRNDIFVSEPSRHSEDAKCFSIICIWQVIYPTDFLDYINGDLRITKLSRAGTVSTEIQLREHAARKPSKINMKSIEILG